MSAATDEVARSKSVVPGALLTLVALMSPGSARAALPPAEGTAAREAAPNTVAPSVDSLGMTWFLPPVRIGGSVAYSRRSDTSALRSTTQTTLNTTLSASTSLNSYIWQPWFARIDGNLGVSLQDSRNSGSGSDLGAISDRNKGVVVNGDGRLSVLPQSKFPFEAYFHRSDNRHSTDLELGKLSSSQRFGFSQLYKYEQGDAALRWNRITTTSTDAVSDVGEVSDVQDSLQLRLAHKLDLHSFEINGDRNTGKRENTGEHTIQDSIGLLHNYTPSSSISVSNMVNASRSQYQLLQGGSNARLLQFSSNAYWRPEGQPMTINGGVRFFTVETDATGFVVTRNSSTNKSVNANANLGASYEFSRFTRLNASINVNQGENNGVRSTSSSQALGVTYRPDGMELGSFRYNWSTSANASNQASTSDSQRQLSLQFSHGLSRSIRMAGGSSIAMDASQGVTAIVTRKTTSLDPDATKQVTHNGSVSWNFSQELGSPVLRFSASDSRSLDGRKDFYQMINFQASSNLPTGPNSSWNGNFTIQSTRQGKDPLPVSSGASTATSNENQDFVTNSSGSVTYQNQRMFGVRRLRFTSDLRLNGQSLLPIFGSSQSQELAAWENRLEYYIGRTQLRLNFLIASSGTPRITIGPVTDTERVRTVNRSIMFSVVRNFGNQ